MSENQRWATCDQPEAFVLIKVLPLCHVTADDLVSFGMLSASFDAATGEEGEASSGLPARRAVIMTCPEALALIEEVDYVGR